MRFLTSETRRLRDYLKLTRLIDDVEPGFYIYLRREGAWLVLCRAGLDEMNERCARRTRPCGSMPSSTSRLSG